MRRGGSDESIHRLLIAISELQDYSARQGPMERTSADEAITMLEEVIEALRKRSPEYTSYGVRAIRLVASPDIENAVVDQKGPKALA